MYNNYRWIFKNSLSSFGGNYGFGAGAGAFCLGVADSAATSDALIGGRLIFL